MHTFRRASEGRLCTLRIEISWYVQLQNTRNISTANLRQEGRVAEECGTACDMPWSKSRSKQGLQSRKRDEGKLGMSYNERINDWKRIKKND